MSTNLQYQRLFPYYQLYHAKVLAMLVFDKACEHTHVITTTTSAHHDSGIQKSVFQCHVSTK